MQPAVAEAGAPGQLEEGASQAGEAFFSTVRQIQESIDELPNGGKEVGFLIHLYTLDMKAPVLFHIQKVGEGKVTALLIRVWYSDARSKIT